MLALRHPAVTSYGMHWALRNRASFAGHDRATQWDQLQRLYFSSYAMWNSLPFLFAQPGGGIDDCFEACSVMERLLSQEWEEVYWVATHTAECRLASLYPKLTPYLHDRLSANGSPSPPSNARIPLLRQYVSSSLLPVFVKSGRFSSCNALQHRCFEFLLQELVGNASSASTHRQCQSDLQPA